MTFNMSNTCYMHIDEAKWYWVDENKREPTRSSTKRLAQKQQLSRFCNYANFCIQVCQIDF